MKRILSLAVFTAALLGSCSKDFEQPAKTAPAGNEVTATLTAGAAAETRAGYDPGDNGVLNFKWHTYNAISVMVPSVEGNENKRFSTTSSGANVRFTGTLTAWTTPQTVYGVYPYSSSLTVTPEGRITALLPNAQAFAVGESRSNMLMVATCEAPTQNDIDFSFKQAASTLRLVIDNLPAAAVVNEVAVSCDKAVFATTADFDPATGEASNPGGYASMIVTVVSAAAAGASTTVDVGLLPADLTGETLTIKIKTTTGEIYTLTKPGRVFVRNVHRKLAVDCGSLTPASSKEMKFTIDTSKDGLQAATYILPISGTLSGCTLTVDWGDETQNVYNFTTAVAEADRTHTYAAGHGIYQITITSSLADPRKQQMPPFNHYNVANKNSAKLVSLDTPLLNMSLSTSTSAVFPQCVSLTEIPENLFENNTNAINIVSFFNGCTGLTRIPANLFASCVNVTNFQQVFDGCTNIEEIPETLFANNLKVTSYHSAFQGTGITTVPKELFANSPRVTTFYGCFQSCSKLTRIPAELFANNPAVTTFEGCFFSNSLLEEIPAGLFANNLKATNFKKCFSNCTKARMNAAIFCDESTEAKASRFAGKGAIDFTDCFWSCGHTLADGGTAPALWTYTFDSVTSTDCFGVETTLSNYSSIPTAWGGPNTGN